MKKWSVAIAIMLLSGLIGTLAGCHKSNTKDVPPNPLEKEGYKLIFHDEFDGTELDTTKWLPQYFPHATDSAKGCATTYKMEDGILYLMIDESTPPYSS